MHRPKGQGGISIRNIGCFNKALLMKKVWRIVHQPQLLFSKVFQSISHRASWIRPTLQKFSLGRRGLLMAGQTLKDTCTWKVGNGLHIRAASQAWVYGKIPTFRDRVTLRDAADTSVADLILPNNQGWNARKINQFFIPSDARLIKSIELPSRLEEEDRPYWPFTRSEDYSTKSGYGLLLQQQQIEICSMTTPVTSKFLRQIWGLCIMPKWKMFLWKIWHNCLATSSNLHYRGITTQNQCLTCLHDNEDDNHIFRTCPLALEAWAAESALNVQPLDQPSLSIDGLLAGTLVR